MFNLFRRSRKRYHSRNGLGFGPDGWIRCACCGVPLGCDGYQAIDSVVWSSSPGLAMYACASHSIVRVALIYLDRAGNRLPRPVAFMEAELPF